MKEPYASLVCTDRRAQEAFSGKELSELGRPLLSDFRARSDEELVTGLAELGVTLDRESLRREASSRPSAEELAAAYVKRHRLRPKDWDFERIWIALTLLWERWLPERASLETLDERIMTGYARLDQDDVTGAVDSWLEAWPILLRILDETKTRSLREFDEVFGLSESVQNWVGDVDMHLWNAGLEKERFFRSGIELVKEYLARFQAEDELTTENMRRALASFHVALGNSAEADALFEEWLARDPNWGWGWIGWSDAYRFDARAKDVGRAESLLLQGLAAPEVRDAIDLLERLHTLYDDVGREDDAREVRARMDALPPEKRQHGPESPIAAPVTTVRRPPKVGRNEPCPCGSGKKYKKCCGR